MDVQHQVLGGVPRVHQCSAKGELLDVQRVIKHFLHVHQLGFVIPVWVKNSPINDPVALSFRANIQTVDDANAFNQPMSVTAVLQSHQFNFVRMILIRNAVIENQKTIRVMFNYFANLFPYNFWRHIVISQVSINSVVRKMLMMVRKISLRVIDLSRNEELAIVSPCWLHGILSIK